MCIRLFGVQLQQIITVLNVSMLTIFKIIGEIQENIIISQKNALIGKKIKVSKDYKMLVVQEVWFAKNVMDGKKNNIIQSSIQNQSQININWKKNKNLKVIPHLMEIKIFKVILFKKRKEMRLISSTKN